MFRCINVSIHEKMLGKVWQNIVSKSWNHDTVCSAVIGEHLARWTYAHMHVCTYGHRHIGSYDHMYLGSYADMLLYSYEHMTLIELSSYELMNT
jgi:hypothetical protein